MTTTTRLLPEGFEDLEPYVADWARATRAQKQFHLGDQELLIRQFHTVIRDTVAAHQEVTS